MGKFKIDCGKHIFSEGEIEILEKYGHWLKALSAGELEPPTERQELFIEMTQGKRQPFSEEEWAWFKYIGRKRIEKEKGDVLYTTPRLEDDPFYSREGAKALRKNVFKTVTESHRK